MKWYWITAICVGLLMTAATAAEKAADAKKEDSTRPETSEKKEAADGKKKESPFKTLKQKVSYGIGLNIGRSLKKDGIDVEAELVAKGIGDIFAGHEPRLSEQELSAAFNEFRKEMAAKGAVEAAAASEKNQKAGEDFLAKNKKRKEVTTTKTGLQYEVLKKGDGEPPKASDTVRVHYHGTLIDGTVFDSSVDRGEPAEFGVGQVISGWTEALQLMKVGDKWKIVLPSELAYGKRGSPPKIGPDSVLVFEVDLLGIK